MDNVTQCAVGDIVRVVKAYDKRNQGALLEILRAAHPDEVENFACGYEGTFWIVRGVYHGQPFPNWGMVQDDRVEVVVQARQRNDNNYSKR